MADISWLRQRLLEVESVDILLIGGCWECVIGATESAPRSLWLFENMELFLILFSFFLFSLFLFSLFLYSLFLTFIHQDIHLSTINPDIVF